jgi:ubiquinone/menaquinone biosynthesis C-methylase UbiE
VTAGYPSVLVGDFHTLPWPDQQFDLLYEVEAMCHVQRLPRMLGEAFRVLRRGGTLLLFDGCRTSEFRSLPEPVRVAARLVEGSMASSRGRGED